MEISKKDWKLFREKAPQWQEAFMARLNREYIELLSGDGSASEKFWALEERIKRDRRLPGVMMEMSRSEMLWNLAALLRDGAITMEDLSDFSDDVKDALAFLMNR